MTVPGLSPGERPHDRFQSGVSVAEALATMTRLFAEAGIETPQRDARLLLQGLLGLDGAQLLSRQGQALGEAAERIGDAARRRAAHEPVSRIVGRHSFYGRDFLVTPDVLDPRSDTETVVDFALEIIRSRAAPDRPLSIADIGTGSGILIVTLLAELPGAQGLATDISSAALAVAQRNAEALGVGDRVRFAATSGLHGCVGPFDLVVSNPPYISTEEIGGLDAEVRDYDPHLALDGGTDGLRVYREIARNIADLRNSAVLVLEVGATQADAVDEIFSSLGAQLIGRRKDLGGHTRVVALEIHP